MATKKKWMQEAFAKNKGKFGAKAKKAGKTTQQYATEKSSASGTLGKEARLAKTAQKIANKRKKKEV